MSLTRSDRRKLRALRTEGYFNTPLEDRIVAAVVNAARVRPQWLDEFLNLGPELEETISAEGVRAVNNASADIHVIFEMLGRADDLHDGWNNPRVIANWLRYGTNAKRRAVAQACDVTEQYAGAVRQKWYSEIVALLADARVLGLSGEDIYLATSVEGYRPTRLLARLHELRTARNERADAPTVGRLAQDVRTAWFDYRVAAGMKGCSPDRLSVYPPHWFVKEFCG